MDTSFWTISGWVIALLSLIVNFLQLQRNTELKKKMTASSQTVGDNSNPNQQTHLGTGHNISAGGNVDVK
jgi:hypothetical protein